MSAFDLSCFFICGYLEICVFRIILFYSVFSKHTIQRQSISQQKKRLNKQNHCSISFHMPYIKNKAFISQNKLGQLSKNIFAFSPKNTPLNPFIAPFQPHFPTPHFFRKYLPSIFDALVGDCYY